jgi:hypothetical protein
VIGISESNVGTRLSRVKIAMRRSVNDALESSKEG